jgi:hypothetical protein
VQAAEEEPFLLDNIFKYTEEAKPKLYWLPVGEEVVARRRQQRHEREVAAAARVAGAGGSNGGGAGGGKVSEPGGEMVQEGLIKGHTNRTR